MKTREETETTKDGSLADLAEAIKAAMPVLDETDQHIATAVHRLMSSGAPVEPAAIAKMAGGVSLERVTERLNTWPGVFRDDMVPLRRVKALRPKWGLRTPSLSGPALGPHELDGSFRFRFHQPVRDARFPSARPSIAWISRASRHHRPAAPCSRCRDLVKVEPPGLSRHKRPACPGSLSTGWTPEVRQ